MASRSGLRGALSAWGCFVFDRPRATLLCLGCLALLMIPLLLELRIDNSAEALLREGDPALETYKESRALFEIGDVVVIMLAPPEVFDSGFLALLSDLHEELEDQVPYVQEVRSLVNARWTRTEGDTLLVDGLLESRADSVDVDRLREQIMTSPLYPGLFISDDAAVVTLFVELQTFSSVGAGPALEGFEPRESISAAEFLSIEEKQEAVRVIEAIVGRHTSARIQADIAGTPVNLTYLTSVVQRDTSMFLTLCFATIGLVLWLLFRSAGGVLMPLLVVAASLITTLAIMAAVGIRLSVISQVLPPLLLLVGVSDAIHILAIAFPKLNELGERRAALRFALDHSAMPVFWTSATTAAGLLSFLPAGLTPVRDLGITGPLGVVLALVYTFTLLPALFAILPLSTLERRDPHQKLRRMLVSLGSRGSRSPWGVIAAASLVLMISLVGIFRVQFSHDIIGWLPEDDAHRRALESIEERFHGIMMAEVFVDSGEANGLYEPGLLRALETTERGLPSIREAHVGVENTVSLLNILRETHQALNENRREFYRVPDRRELIAQELLLFENTGSEDLFRVSDANLQTARMTLQIPWADSRHYVRFLEQLEYHFARTLDSSVQVAITGLTGLMARAFSAVITSMAQSYILAFLTIAPLMLLILRSVRLGLLSLIPNLMPIVMTLGLMGWLEVPLDATTILIGSIVFGIAVDDTIHLFYKYRDYRVQQHASAAAIERTLETTGCALLFTSLVMVTGFGVYAAAYTANILHFGLLSAFAVASALLADVLLVPALLALVDRRGRRPKASLHVVSEDRAA